MATVDEASTKDLELNSSCVGSNSTHIKLISMEGDECVIKRELTEQSEVMKDMLNPPGGVADDVGNSIKVPVNSKVLEKLCEFLEYTDKYRNCGDCVIHPDFQIPPEIAYEVYEIADYFDI